MADSWNHCIRVVNSTGETRTISGDAGVPGFTNPCEEVNSDMIARFSCPHDVTIDRDGNILVCDTDNNVIRKIDSEGNVTTLAGTGVAGLKDGDCSTAKFNKPKGIAMDSNGEYCIVADTGNHCIRRVSPSGLVVTVAGKTECGFVDGEMSTARFHYPMGVSVDAEGRYIVADAANNRIRMVTPRGLVSTIVGAGALGYTEGAGASALFNCPAGVAASPTGGFLVTDCWNHRVRFVSESNQQHVYGNTQSGSGLVIVMVLTLARSALLCSSFVRNVRIS